MHDCSQGLPYQTVAQPTLAATARAGVPASAVLGDIAELYKNFADTTRLKILYLLLDAELCVCDIAQLLDMSQSAISHQLRVLKNSRLVKNRREGKTVFYSLADAHIYTILQQGMEHVNE